MTQKEKKVFVGIPSFWYVDPYFHHCCLRLVQEFTAGGIHGMMKMHFGETPIGRARNDLTRLFLESDCTHLLMIDSDLIFSPDHVNRIMEHNDPIVGGIYCKKQEGSVEPVMNTLSVMPDKRPDGLIEVKYIGTGFIRIAREVFEKMIEKYGDEIEYKKDPDLKKSEWDFWRMGVYRYPDGMKRWLSEDWYFNQVARDLGYKVYADLAVVLKHSGHAIFPLSYQEKQLFTDMPELINFSCPEDCMAGVMEVYQGQYDFPFEFKEPPKVLDIGANVGAFAWWCDWKWPGAKVKCYEPNPEIFESLRNNCDRIGAEAVPFAVGNPELTKLHKGKNNRLECSLYKNGSQTEEVIPVSTVEITDVSEYDLVKVDTEGSECDVVGSFESLPNYLVVEYHSSANRNQVIATLRGRTKLIGHKSIGPGYGVMAFQKV